jgi:hypothetical protein
MLIQIRRALHIKHENAQENCIRIRQNAPIRAGFSLCDKISRSPNFFVTFWLTNYLSSLSFQK